MAGGGKWKAVVNSREDGEFFCVPWNATQTLHICRYGRDSDKVHVELLSPDLGYRPRDKWLAAVQAPNDQVFCIPASAQQVLRLNFMTSPGSRQASRRASRASK
mmetsp:Transcript_131031/g.407514  ORF Transcript_131031/g.407514 Transcript_131031/m.407514 type:complete len:104 (+) Transcript_131031:401-712(+)